MHEKANTLDAEEACRQFYKSINIETFHKSKNAVRMLFVLEYHKSGVPHIHLLSEDPTYRILNNKKRNNFDFKKVVRSSWINAGKKTCAPEKTCGLSNRWFETINESDRVTQYVTKHIPDEERGEILWELYAPEGRRIPSI
ncbi:hypothetical protein [Thioalkalivibrio sp. ALMg13-2]|uniref:rolling circle replication-associated protein n=1 Tax=Thioalkalivibrio sp. ALMg13-2 TaxID=1158167 RepID=UPI0012DDB16D|nr:hypothetical protein [Thioalkalivibrio sp. ALMg13-2]